MCLSLLIFTQGISCEVTYVLDCLILLLCFIVVTCVLILCRVIFVVVAYYLLHIMVVCVCLSFIVYLLWFAAFVANKDIHTGGAAIVDGALSKFCINRQSSRH